jgi:predicted PurR-regulated permease PerM
VPETTDTTRQLVKATLVVVLAVFVAWLIYLARAAILLVYVSALLAIGFAPLIRLIERQRLLPIGPRRFPRWLAILVVYVGIVAVIVAILLAVLPLVIQQASDLSARLPGMFSEAQQYLKERGIIRQAVTLGEAVTSAPNPSEAVSTLVATVLSVVGGLIGVVTMLILTFYLLVDAESIFAGFVRLFPPQERPYVSEAAREISLKVSAWLGGNLILGAVMGTAVAIGLFAIGVPYFYVVALIAAFGELIPLLGPIIAGATAVAAALTVSLKLALFALVYFVLLHQLESNVLVPKIMERQVGLSPVAIIVSLLIGAEIYGIIGAILAVPTAAILQVVYEELTARQDERRRTTA